MRIPLLIVLTATLCRAQSRPPRKNIPAIAKAANGAVVSIIMSDKAGQTVAQGSGFVIREDGRIVTNYHVIAEGTSAVVKLPNGAFFVVDGVLAANKDRDIAIIKAHGENFHTVQLGDSNRVQVGDEVVAIGNPLSLESTVSDGIVSAIRTVQDEGGKFLQITAPISPGSSGGPLFNMAGQVVGITSARINGGENLNFAIPINAAKRLLARTNERPGPFPDGDIESRNAPTASAIRRSGPTTAPEYFQELLNSGGVSSDYHYVCFRDTDDPTFILLAPISGQMRVAFYNKGVRVALSDFTWSGRSWEFDDSPPTDSDAHVVPEKSYVLSIENTTLRYNLSLRVTVRIGEVSDTRAKELEAGVCEWISQRAHAESEKASEQPDDLATTAPSSPQPAQPPSQSRSTEIGSSNQTAVCVSRFKLLNPKWNVNDQAIAEVLCEQDPNTQASNMDVPQKETPRKAAEPGGSAAASATAPDGSTTDWVPSGWKRCRKDDGEDYYAFSCPTTATVTKIENAIITVPGLTVEDYQTCIKRGQELPEGIKRAMEAQCKQIADLGIPPGDDPATKERGFLVTFETSDAVYVAWEQGRCDKVVGDRCGGDWVVDVVVGQKYEFTRLSDTLVMLSDLPRQGEPDNKVAELMGNLESMVQKKASAKAAESPR